MDQKEKAVAELLVMAKVYHDRGMYDKAAEVMALVERMEQAHHRNNVISMSDYQDANQHERKA